MKKKIDIMNLIVVGIMVSFKYLKMYELFPDIALYGYLAVLLILVIANIYTMGLSKKEYIKILALFTVCLFTFVTNRDVNLLVSFFVALLFFRKDIREFVRYFAWCSIGMFVLTILLNSLGIIEGNNMIRYTQEGTIQRYALGFETPNALFLYFMPIVFALYYAYGANKKVLVVSAVCSTFLFYLTNCRTGFLLTILFVLYVAIWKDTMPKILQKILPYVFLILTVVTFGIAITQGPVPDSAWNDWMSGRPYLWNYYYTQGLHTSLLGGNLNEEYILDSFYLHILVHLGILAYVFYAFVYYKTSKTTLRQDEKALNLILFYLLYGLVETNTVLASTNFIFVLQFRSIMTDAAVERKLVEDGKTNN